MEHLFNNSELIAKKVEEEAFAAAELIMYGDDISSDTRAWGQLTICLFEFALQNYMDPAEYAQDVLSWDKDDPYVKGVIGAANHMCRRFYF